MAFKDEFGNLGQRFAEFAARLEERTRSKQGAGNGGLGLQSILGTLRDLFTKDVTREGLRDLVKRDPRDILRFYTHGIDFESLRPLPWYKRYPGMAWKVFVATAYRLSPARRIAFAVAILAFFIGGIRLLFLSIQIKNQGGSGAAWWLLTIAILALLLLMELRDKLDLKVDLEIAREIQFGLVPSQPFKRDATAIHGFMRPANTVGGDYFDIIVLNDRQVGVVIGDVAGKGMPAALLMALLQGSLRTLITAGFRGPELIAKLNEYLCASLPSNSLVTLFYGELNTASGEFRYVNAGHNAPFLIRPGAAFDRLHSTSPALGIRILKESHFEARDACLGAGERLLLYTDGIAEAFNEADEEYGEERLEDFLRTHMGLKEKELIGSLMDSVLRFCGDVRQSDDMTLLLIERG